MTYDPNSFAFLNLKRHIIKRIEKLTEFIIRCSYLFCRILLMPPPCMPTLDFFP